MVKPENSPMEIPKTKQSVSFMMLKFKGFTPLNVGKIT